MWSLRPTGTPVGGAVNLGTGAPRQTGFRAGRDREPGGHGWCGALMDATTDGRADGPDQLGARDPERLLRDAAASLRSGTLEIERLTDALNEARRELDAADRELAAVRAPTEATRAVVVAILPELRRPALLVDGDLRVIARNAAADEIGADAAAGTGLSHLVRAAVEAPPGRIIGAGGSAALSLGIAAAPDAPGGRLVLVLVDPEPRRPDA